MLCSWWYGSYLQQAYPDVASWIIVSEAKSKPFTEFDVVRIKFSMFRFSSKRKDSAIRTLVAETLVLAKTHGYVEKIEHELEEELQRENTEPPNRILAKWRRNGEKLLKNKYTLLTVAFFCVTECALILGELILDLHKVKDVLESQEQAKEHYMGRLKDLEGQEAASKDFMQNLNKLYPNHVAQDGAISIIYENILRSKIVWYEGSSASSNQTSLLFQDRTSFFGDNETRHKRSADYEETMFVIPSGTFDRRNTSKVPGTTYRTEGSSHDTDHSAEENHGHSLEEEIAHAFHKASITILSILVFETILKALCAGTAFFQRKLEIMPRYKIQDFVFILAFLLPWRVIRVVNSLVVAVQDHEHFRLKLIYGRKKKIVNSLRESEIKLQLFRAQCNALKRLCFNEGIDESKIDQILMVEECVVNKAGKSKCKIKIDNSSVILLNDKSDFPRLSPRPSLLNLVEKVGGRRKSMQPQGAPGSDRDLFTNAKDSPKKGILKFRARSNSESGRGTLNSPDDVLTHHGGIGDVGAFSGLNTPIVINRKSSLSSPIMANHVRNILNSLEDRVNQMNGSCSRMGSGRGSIDANSIAEEVEDICPARRFGRRVHSIDETTERELERDYKSISYASKRRASLQPQKCVDEDDMVLVEIKPLAGPSSLFKPPGLQAPGGPSTCQSIKAVIETKGEIAPVHSQKFSPTTIQIDPPSVNSSYSLSSSASSHSSNNKHSSSEHPRLGVSPTMGISPYGKKSPQDAPVIPHSCGTTSGVWDPRIVASPSSETVVPEREIQPNDYEMTTMPVAAVLKPKTLRTPSDIENQNSLTESLDICESQSNDAGTRNTSIEEIEDDFDNSGNVLSISNTDGSVLSGTCLQSELKQTHAKPDFTQKMEGAKGNGSACAVSTESNGTVGKCSRNMKDGKQYSSAKCSSVETSEIELKSDSVSNLLS